jgi:hypothetical protein
MRHAIMTAMVLGLALHPGLAPAANGDNASADGRYLAPNGPPADATARLFHQPITEVQARGVLAAGGYTAVGGFTRSQDGTLRTRAIRNGMAAEVGVDRSGRIVAN